MVCVYWYVGCCACLGEGIVLYYWCYEGVE